MGDLNGLLRSLRDEIAIAGEKGASIDNILLEVQSFYDRKSRHINNGAPVQNVDRAFLERVWTWLCKDPDVFVGSKGEGNVLTLSQIEARNLASKPLRLFTTDNQIWLTLTGHEKDIQKVPAKAFELLVLIAAAKNKGITQPDCVKITGQDKRSVPSRTQKLADAGYVKKIPVLANHANTSLLVHSKYWDEFSTPRSGRQIAVGSVNDKIFLGHNRHVRAEPEIRAAMKALETSENGLLLWEELKRQSGVKDAPASKILAEAIRRFEEFGVTARVRASTSLGRDNGNASLHRCVQLLRPPTDHEWRLIFEWTRAESRQQAGPEEDLEMAEKPQHDDDAENVEVIPDVQAEVEYAHNPYAPIWNPDRLLAHSIREALLEAGETGVSTKDLKHLVTGPFYIRPVDRFLDRTEKQWHKSQPLNLRRLALIRDSSQSGKTSFYVHFIYDAFGVKVEHGETSWEAVKTSVEPDVSMQVDQYGFRIPSPSEFAGNGNLTLREAVEAVNSIRSRKHENVPDDPVARHRSSLKQARRSSNFSEMPGIHTPAETPVQTRIQTPTLSRSQTPASILPAAEDEDEPSRKKGRDPSQQRHSGVTVGRPRKYALPGDSVDFSSMTPEQVNKVIKSQKRAQEYVRKKAHKEVEARVAAGILRDEAETAVIAQLGLTRASYEGNTIMDPPELSPPSTPSKKTRKRKRGNEDQYLPSVVAHTTPLLIPPVERALAPINKKQKIKHTKCVKSSLYYFPSSIAHTTLIIESPQKKTTTTVPKSQKFKHTKCIKSALKYFPSILAHNQLLPALSKSTTTYPQRKTDRKATRSSKVLVNGSMMTSFVIAPDSPSVSKKAKRSKKSDSKATDGKPVPHGPYDVLSPRIAQGQHPLTTPSSSVQISQGMVHSELSATSTPNTAISLAVNPSSTFKPFPTTDEPPVTPILRFSSPQSKSETFRTYSSGMSRPARMVSSLTSDIDTSHGQTVSPASQPSRPMLADKQTLPSATLASSTESTLEAESAHPELQIATLVTESTSERSVFPIQKRNTNLTLGTKDKLLTANLYHPLQPRELLTLQQEKARSSDVKAKESNTSTTQQSIEKNATKSLTTSEKVVDPSLPQDNMHTMLVDASRGPTAEKNDQQATRIVRTLLSQNISLPRPSTRRSLPFGGTIAHMRRLIILETVRNCNGVFPGDGELAYPFRTAFALKFPGTDPDSKTIKSAKTLLIGNKELKQIFFSCKSSSGLVVSKSIIALPEISDIDPRVKTLQQEMAKKHPHPYFPPGTSIRPDLVPKAASYNFGDAKPLVLGSYSNRLPVVTDRVVVDSAKAISRCQYGKENKLTSNENSEEIKRSRVSVKSIRKRKTLQATEQQDETVENPAVEKQTTNAAAIIPVESISGLMKRKRSPDVIEQTGSTPIGATNLVFQDTSATADAAQAKDDDVQPTKKKRKQGVPTETINQTNDTPIALAVVDDQVATTAALIGSSASTKRPGDSTPSHQFSTKRRRTSKKNESSVAASRQDSGQKKNNRRGRSIMKSTASNPKAGIVHSPEFATAQDPSNREEQENGSTIGSELRTPKRLAMSASRSLSSSLTQQAIIHSAPGLSLTAQSAPNQTVPATGYEMFQSMVDDIATWEMSRSVASSANSQDGFIHYPFPDTRHVTQSTMRNSIRKRKEPKNLPKGSQTSTEALQWGSRKAKSQPSSSGSVAKKLTVLETLQQKSEKTPGIRISDRQSRAKGPQARRPKTEWSTLDDRRLLIGFLFEQAVLGGIRGEPHWRVVSMMLEERHSREACRRRFATVKSKYRAEIEIITSTIRTAWLDGIESGEAPSLDYSDWAGQDWPGILAWIMDKVEDPDFEDVELPSSREAFEAKYFMKDFLVHEPADFLEGKKPASVPVRVDVLNTEPRVFRDSPPKQISNLEKAKTFVRANVLTPKEDYDARWAREKLAHFGEEIIDQALADLLADKLISQSNKGRAIPGRTYDVTNSFLKSLQLKLNVAHFKYAAAFKEILDKRFAEHDKMDYNPAFGNGDILTLINLLADGQISLKGHGIPNNKFGMTTEGYKTRTMDKSVFMFDITAHATNKFRPGLPIRPLPEPPLDSTGCLSPAESRIPLWVDINGSLLPPMWDIALAAVGTYLVILTAATAKGIAAKLQPYMADFEVELIMNWLVQAGAAEWKDEHHDVLTLGPWWWSVITTPIAKAGPGEQAVMIAGVPMQ